MTGAAETRGKRSARPPGLHAVVLKRTDFRESSRIVTCLTREHGRITGLAKGAHRPDSPFLGRLDFLAEIDATFSPDRGGLRLLERATLRLERRGLREPVRFLAASHLAFLCDCAMPDARPEPAVFDLLVGGLALLERCPPERLGHVVLGLELRLLAQLGALPDLDHCAECGTRLGHDSWRHADAPGLVCRAHARPPRQAVTAQAMELLRALHGSSGRQWPVLAVDVPAELAAPLPAAWLAAATEQRPRLRPVLFAHLRDSSRGHADGSAT
ncbi:MAG: DNA repair protein RecO [Planctomycetes bacterium]|nr:DNA repair protein RecO [Planctomycetota bacterium]